MMKSHGSKSEVSGMVAERAPKLSEMPAHVSGWVPVVFVGQVSPRIFMVGTCYQPAGLIVGDTFRPACPSDFIGGKVNVAAV